MARNSYELLYFYHQNQSDGLRVLAAEHEPMLRAQVNQIVASNRMMALYREEFLQESRIMLVAAAECYRFDQGCSFRSYLQLSAKRKIFQRIKHYNSSADVPFHTMVSLDSEICENTTIYDVVKSRDLLAEPEYALSYKEANLRLNQTVEGLKPMEQKVLREWESGSSYEESCQRLHRSYKAYDGRLQRVKEKVRASLHEA